MSYAPFPPLIAEHTAPTCVHPPLDDGEGVFRSLQISFGDVNALDSAGFWRIADLTLDDTIGAMADRILAAAPPRFAIGAVSLGGYVAFELYRRAPDRITHLALMNSSARADTEAQTERRGQVVRAAGVGAFKGVTPRLLPAILHPDHVSNPHMAETVLAMAERIGRVAFQRQAAAIIDRPDSRGNRRYFTIASAPGEEEVRLGVKIVEHGSAFKRELAELQPGDQIVRPLQQLAALLGQHAEHVADHRHRQRSGDVADEVALALLANCVDQCVA